LQGFFIGVLPGAGATIASFLGYAVERNIAPKDEQEEFGKGSIKGLAAPEAANLRAIDTLEQAFQVPVGWSDHTLGEAVAVAAVARGAVIVEKHFTLDKSLPGPDHKASLSPEELQSYIAAIRTVELALGDGIKRPHPSELPTIAAARRSLILNRDMAAGEVIGEADIVTLRPGHGLAPKHRVHVIGRTMQAARPQGHVLSWSDLT
jgi:N-acetylneuraminate synthase/N,N'-diacetyllegionaminate synthase